MLSPAAVTAAPWQRWLVVGVVAAAIFAAWAWLRPYAWRPDPAARCEVAALRVKRDRSNYWVDVHLEVRPGQAHDLFKPVRLVTSAGREIEVADTRFAGDPRAPTALWCKFWLERADLEGTLALRINDGRLAIKSRPGLPRLGPAEERTFPTHTW